MTRASKTKMNERKEGPLERKFWMAVGVLTFGPIAFSLGAMILGSFLGEERVMDAIEPIFWFGMTMVGLVLFGFSLKTLFQGKVEWFGLIGGGAWLLFFGRAFLHAIGVGP